MRREIDDLIRQLQGDAFAIAVRRHEENEHVALLVHHFADVVHGSLEIAQRRQRHVSDRRRMIYQTNRPVLDRQYPADGRQPAVDFLGEDIERGPAGHTDGVDVGLALAMRRQCRSLGLQQRGLSLLQPGKLAVAGGGGARRLRLYGKNSRKTERTSQRGGSADPGNQVEQ